MVAYQENIWGQISPGIHQKTNLKSRKQLIIDCVLIIDHVLIVHWLSIVYWSCIDCLLIEYFLLIKYLIVYWLNVYCLWIKYWLLIEYWLLIDYWLSIDCLLYRLRSRAHSGRNLRRQIFTDAGHRSENISIQKGWL